VVIYDFHIFRTCIGPTKADPPLIVYADAILTRTITPESFKMIAGWNPQIIKPICDFELSKFDEPVKSRNLRWRRKKAKLRRANIEE
jgi:hypothetical protein